MKKFVALLLVSIMLLSSCGAPTDTTADNVITDAPETNSPDVTDASDVTDAPDAVDSDKATEPSSPVTEVTEPVETDPPVPVDRFDYSIDVKEDTYVLNKDSNGDKSKNNYSSDLLIDVKSNKGNLTRYGFLKFDISSLKGDSDFTAIELDLFIEWRQNDAGNPELGALEIYGCDTAWDVKEVTFNSQPMYFERICILDDITTEKTTRSFPVTDYVRKALANGQTEVAFYVKEATPKVPLRFKITASEAGTNIPKLSVYYGTKVDSGVYEGKTILGDPEVSKNGLDAILGQNKVEAFHLKALEDTYVEAGTSADTNFGAAEVIEFKAMAGTANNYYRIGLVKFDLSKISGGKIGYANLSLNCAYRENNTPVTVHAYSCDSSKWSENSVTYNTAPTKEDIVGTAVVNGLGIFYIDVTDYVNECLKYGDSTISFYLEGDQDSVRRLKFSTKESKNPAPELICSNSDVSIITYIQYKSENPWEVAMNNYNEWVARWETIKKGGDPDTEVIVKDSAEYSISVGATRNPKGAGTTYTQYPTRAVSTLKGYTPNKSEVKQYDEYGGLKDESLKQEATGFFYTKKIGDRWWTIDPLGYPFFRTAVVSITIGNAAQKAKFLAKYGDVSGWGQAITDRLFELGFNFAGGWSTIATLIEADNPISQTQIIGLVGTYASSLGLNVSKSGSTDLVGNVLPVFDPDFAVYVDSKVSSTVSKYANSPYVYGWMSDNELPDELNMLDSSLLFDINDPRYIYTYANAWTFMYMKTGKANVSIADVTDEHRREYRAMVYDKLFSLACGALEKYDPNHQFMGCRFLAGCFKDEYVLRVAGYWCDLITLNYYGAWEGDATVIANIQKYAGKPFVITEWYAKGMDVWEKDNRMTNTSGAGWTVKNQNDRGLFYQNYALQLLECKGCVGFDWFKFLDNDPEDLSTDESNRNANKGIIDNNADEYTVLTDYMKELNTQKYNLIKFFDER